MVNRRILLTGAGGYLGQIIQNKLIPEGFEVTTLGRSNQDLNVDISSPFYLSPELIFDMVIHSAGKAHVIPRTEEEEQEFYNVNFIGTKNLCAALDALKLRPTTFIFISTVAVYGLSTGNAIPESSPLKGETPYAKSKIFAEEYLKRWAELNGVKLIVLRLPLIAGENPPGNLGAMIRGISNGRYLSIGKADARKSIVWGEDIAGLIPNLAGKNGIYNLTDGNHPNFAELECIISAAFKRRRPSAIPLTIAKAIGKIGDYFGPRSPINSDKIEKITSTLTFDDTLANRELNWKPSSVLQQLQKCL